MIRVACVALLLTACYSPLDNPESTGSPTSCSSHETVQSCMADEACVPATCTACDGTVSLVDCFPITHAPEYHCPALDCPTESCDSFDDPAACTAAGCDAEMCPGCGGSDVFVGCFDPGLPLHCASPVCPATCADHITEASCRADATCFPVYEDAYTCGCAEPGCCMQFSHCDLGPPNCGSTTQCENFAPIVCGAAYTPIIEHNCVVGCTLADLCAPLGD